MFIQRHFILFLTTIYSGAFAAIHDEDYISKNGPFGLIKFKKNDTFIDWVRVPEVNYKQWISALKVWRTCSIVLGILCLIFAALVLAYIIHGVQTNSAGPFTCFGESKSDHDFLLSNGNLPVNLQQLALQHQLKLPQYREQEAQRQKYEVDQRRFSAMYRNPTSSALLTNHISLKTSLK